MNVGGQQLRWHGAAAVRRLDKVTLRTSRCTESSISQAGQQLGAMLCCRHVCLNVELNS